MEQVEDTFVVGAIGWLAQTILASLFAGKLEAWIRELGLADDIEKLKSEIERAEMVAAAVKGRAAGNRPLARSLARLKELLYDADDAIDELDYYRLKQQVEGGTCRDSDGTDGDGAEQLERSRGDADIPSSSGAWKPRSQAWKDFMPTKFNEKGKPTEAKCNYCHEPLQCGSKNGTSVLLNHLKSANCTGKRGASDQQPNPSSTADGAAHGTPVAIGDSGSRKRMRMDEVSTHPWNKAEFSNRIQQIARQLQDIRGAVSEVLKLCGSSSVPSSDHHWSTSSRRHLRTSSPIQRKMYGRFAEKDTILKLMEAGKSDSITVLPIVGTGGIGKTALARFAYNCSDPRVENLFDHRIWVWVSNNFDEVKLTREMLDFASQERHEGISSFAKLQEILKKCMELKRFLLILDDVWDGVHDYQWDELLAPFKSNHTKGNVVLVTTRNLSVAKRMGTVGPIELGAMEHDDFLLLLQACAFGDNKYEGHQSLNTIGQKIAKKLDGNPLAAETAGKLLKEHLNIDHWNTILKNEAWKSLEISRGIISVLKISLDHLPYHLQQCFLYCSIFPNSYPFSGEELIQIWISQGFVYHRHSSKTTEDIGQDYLVDLVNSGFFTPEKGHWYFMDFTVSKDERYVIPGLMRDLARKVSRTECANIDGRECNDMEPTIRHLSIGSGFGDQGENNEYFEKNMLKAAKSIKKLRSLVLFGGHGSNFFQSFQHMFKEARNLRLLKVSATYADLNSFLCNLVNLAHIRYLKLEGKEDNEVLPGAMSKFYHLQILDVRSQTYHSEISSEPSTDTETEEEGSPMDDTDNDSATVATWLATSLISLKTLRLECCGKLQIVPSLERLPFLTKLELRNMRNVTEVSIPSLDELVLDKMPMLERYSCSSVMDLNSSLRILKITRCAVLKVFPLFESSEKFRIEQKSWLSDLRVLIIHKCPQLLVSHPLPPSTSVSKLSIWRVSTLPTMKGSSSETLTIKGSAYTDWGVDESSDELRTLDGKMLSFHNLRFLTKLAVKGCPNLTSISLEGFRQLISLKIFEIWDCEKLFSSHVLPEDTHEDMAAVDRNALPSLERLLIVRCRITVKWLSLMLRHAQALQELYLMNCLQKTTCLSVEEENSQSNLISVPEASSSGCPDDTPSSSAPDGLFRVPLNLIPSLVQLELFGGNYLETLQPCFPGNLTYLKKLKVWESPSLKSLWLHSCTALEELKIECCISLAALEGLQSLGGLRHLQVSSCESLKSLQLHCCTALEELKIKGCISVSLEGFRQLISLKIFEIYCCKNLFSSHVLPEDTIEDMAAVDCNALPSLECLRIESCGITGKWLSLMLRHMQALQELDLTDCLHITWLSVEEENSQSNLISAPEASSSGCPDGTSSSSTPEGLLRIPLNLIPSLKRISVDGCPDLTFCGSKDGLAGFTSLEELIIQGCFKLLSSLVHKDGNDDQANGRCLLPQSLVQLQLGSHYLEMLQPNLEMLLPSFPGNLTCLKKLMVRHSPSLKSLRLHSCTALEELKIESCGTLAALEGLQSLGGLRHLQVSWNESLKSLQLHCCTALEELKIEGCISVGSLVGLHSLPSLKRLEISYCTHISRLPEKGLPPSLEELVIDECPEELIEQCRTLATSKLKVKINCRYVN